MGATDPAQVSEGPDWRLLDGRLRSVFLGAGDSRNTWASRGRLDLDFRMTDHAGFGRSINTTVLLASHEASDYSV